MEHSPKVSIISLCYNQEKYCIQSLNSIYHQTYRNFEVILIDDFSDDNSVNIIKEWIDQHRDIKMTFIEHTQNKGITTSLAEAFKLVSGEYFCFLACDDLMLEDKLEKQVQIFSGLGNDTALIYGDAYIIDENGKLIPHTLKYFRKINHFHSGKIFEKLLLINFVNITTALIRTDHFRSVGGFDTSLSFEDYDMILRLARIYTIQYHDYIGIKYRKHSQGTSVNLVSKHGASYLKLLHKHIDYPDTQRMIHFRMREVLMGKSIHDFQEGLELYEKYDDVFKNDILLRVLFANKYIFLLITWLPYKMRDRILFIRNKFLSDRVAS